jgi:DNA-directed RNA polymerase subunit K/omega
LVIATAKRARQIIERAEKEGGPIPDNAVRYAVLDIATGKTSWHEEHQEESECKKAGE